MGGASYLDSVSKEGTQGGAVISDSVQKAASRRASWKREKLELGLDVGSGLQMSEKTEGVSSIVQVGERNDK